MRNLSNFRQAAESWNSMGYFCPKIAFLQLKYYIHKIYLTLLSTTCMKIHQIPYVIFSSHESVFLYILHHPSVSWHIIPLKLSSWNIICFGQKEPIIEKTNETKRSGFIQILHHCSVSWKITPLYFFSSNTLDKKSPSK